MADLRSLGKRIVGAGVVLLVGLQLVPYGRDHDNPPAGREVQWDSPKTRAIAKRACFDCHSTETKWPWYSNLAPISWLLQNHVDEGREELNFTAWDGKTKHIKEGAELVQKGAMPIPNYLWLHPEARLSAEDKAALIAGLEAMAKINSSTTAAAEPKAIDNDEDEDEDTDH